MKHLIVQLGAICLAFILLPSCAPAPETEVEAALDPRFDQEAEEAAIRKFVVDVFAAFNRHDAKALAELEEHYIDFTGTISHEEALKRYDEAFANYRDVHVELVKEIGIDFLKPDVAIQRRVTRMSASSGPDGKPVPPSYGLRASVLMKKNGKWVLAANFERDMIDEEISQLTDTE